MAEIIQRNDEFYVRFYGNGLLFEKYAGSDRSRAEAILKEITDSLPNGAMSHVKPAKTIEEYFHEFKELNRAQLAASSRRLFADAGERFLSFARSHLKPGATLAAVTPKVVEDFRNALKSGGETPLEANFQLYLLRCILDHAVTKGYLGDNPTLHVRFLKTETPPILDPAELKSLEKAAKGKEKIILDYLAGAIPLGEKLKGIRWSDLAHEGLRNNFINKLLQDRVPLTKVYENLQMDDISLLKPFIGLVPSNLP